MFLFSNTYVKKMFIVRVSESFQCTEREGWGGTETKEEKRTQI